jgi:hypothetical protein
MFFSNLRVKKVPSLRLKVFGGFFFFSIRFPLVFCFWTFCYYIYPCICLSIFFLISLFLSWIKSSISFF